MTWTRKPQGNPGKYFFSGQFYITKGVSESLSLEEITAICLDLKAFVKEQNGIDYLQGKPPANPMLFRSFWSEIFAQKSRTWQNGTQKKRNVGLLASIW